MVPYKLHLLMPTYKRACCLERTLGAVFGQTADCALWHLTVVDNASSDNTVPLLEGFAAKHANFDFTVNEHNLGLFGNINRCMDLARTQKYMVIHSDDVVAPTLVTTALEAIARHPEATMFFGRYRASIERTGEIIENGYRSVIMGDEDRIIDHRFFLSALLWSGTNLIFPPTVIYDRSLFTPDLRYSSEYEFASDLDLWFRAAMRKPIVGFIAQPQITFSVHPGSLSDKYADIMRTEHIAIVRKYMKLLRNVPDMHGFDDRAWFFISLKLWAFSVAIRLHIVPGFKARRRIARLIERLSYNAALADRAEPTSGKSVNR